MKRFCIILLLVAITGFTFAERGTLVSDNWYKSKIYTTSMSNKYIESVKITPAAKTWCIKTLGAPQYNVKAYQIVYISVDHSGKEIPVSGVVLVPQTNSDAPLPLLVYQHGTIIDNSGMPSGMDSSDEAKLLFATFATRGYVVAMTDYVGCGLETSVPNEYLYAASEAANGVDIIKATSQLLQKLKMTSYSKLYVTGYSEGGQGASALSSLIQENYPQYTVQAAALMEGPYNMTELLNYFLKPGGVTSSGRSSGSIVSTKALYSYNNIYNWGGMSNIFVPPYAVKVNNIFSKLNPSVLSLAMAFPADTRKMLTNDFYTSVQSGSAGIEIASNDTDNWVPKMKTYITSSNADTLIPDTVALNTYNKMKAAGGNVVFQYTPFPLDHLPNFLPSLVLTWVNFKNN